MAVFTPLTLPEAQTLLAQYPIGRVHSIEGIASGVENTNFKIESDAGRFILTLIERRLTQFDIPFFLDLLDHLHQAGIPCPRAIRPTEGELVPLCKGKPVMLVSFLAGKEVVDPSPQQILSLGRMMARLHCATQPMTEERPNTVGVQSWHKMLVQLGNDPDELTPGLTQKLAEEYVWLAEHWPKHAPSGLVHADLFPDNVFFQTIHVSGIIDFYFTCTAPWLYDFAITFNAWCFQREGKGEWKIQRDLARALWRGYAEHRASLGIAVTEEEWQWLPLFHRAACLRFFLTRAMDHFYPAADALVTAKDPMEYWQKLQFHQQHPDPASYGLHWER